MCARWPLLAALAVLVGLNLFYRFARPFWVPVKLSLTGMRTVKEVLDALRPRMSKRFEGIASLTDGAPLALLAFKKERRLELWKESGGKWRWVRSYPFTAFSGKLGPKLREGDRQIPEGVYAIQGLNPNSTYHLSMQIDYPNAFDRLQAGQEGRTNLGGEIFIHGSEVTIGCIPVGNAGIEELFYVVASNGPKHTRVIIAPVDFRKGEPAPKIAGIDWEAELYARIRAALGPFAPGK